MPFYFKLSNKADVARRRTARNLLKLREALQDQVPKRTVNKSLLLASWNLREFGKNMYGGLLEESYYYIAEIISAFDIVTLQEVSEDISDVEKLIEILGPSWSYFASASSLKRTDRNRRLVFIFDTRKIKFKNIAGQIILDDNNLIQDKYQFARAPYFAKFQAENFEFSLCAVHMWYGGHSERHINRRVEEIKTLTELLNKKSKRDDSNIIILGNFNIVNLEHETMQVIKDAGYSIPEGLLVPSHVMGDRFYDQIALKEKKNELCLGASKPSSGVFNFFDILFQSRDFKVYSKEKKLMNYFNRRGKDMSAAKKRKFYNFMWKTSQISDHYPLWVELKVDFSNEKLAVMKKS